MIASPALRDLDIADNSLSDVASAVAALGSCPHLVSIACGGNPWGQSGVADLADGLPGAAIATNSSERGTAVVSLSPVPLPAASDAWTALAPRLSACLAALEVTEGGDAARTDGEVSTALERWLACLGAIGSAGARAAAATETSTLLGPPATRPQLPRHVTAAAIRMQAWWRGVRVRLQLARALGSLDFADDDDFEYGDVDVSEFDAGLDSLDRDYADLRPPAVIAAAAAAATSSSEAAATGRTERETSAQRCAANGAPLFNRT